MPDVKLPDGTIIKNVPEGITKAELARRLGRDVNALRDKPLGFEPVSEFKPEVGGPVNAAMISAGKTLSDIASNIRQAIGSDQQAQEEMAQQERGDRLFSTVAEERPVASFLGGTLPYFAIPGGKVAQGAFGAVQGALEGDTAGQRTLGAGVGLISGVFGQKAGDYLGARIQNFGQRLAGNPNASARAALLKAGVPMNLSERTDGIISKPLARFFERGRFVLTGSQPKGAAQQKQLTELITEALGIKAPRLTREALGEADRGITQVFQSAAARLGSPIRPGRAFRQEALDAIKLFDEVGTDSAQIGKVFDQFRDLARPGASINPEVYLRLRSNLGQMTTKSDAETKALVAAIDSLDNQVARIAPDLADELRVARDRFRLMLAIRRGASLSPQGDINTNSFTKSLERIFSDFDVGKPLPRSLEGAGEAMAGFNQVADPFRSSGTAENALSAGLPSASAAADPSGVLKVAAGALAPFAGGGTGGLIGGGVGRVGGQSLLDLLLSADEVTPGYRTPLL